MSEVIVVLVAVAGSFVIFFGVIALVILMAKWAVK